MKTTDNSRCDIDLLRLQEKQDKPKYKQALNALVLLRKAGYEVLYGWSKGHGFWIKGQYKPDGSTFFTVKQSLALINQ